MITLHFHLQPQYKYELFHINFTVKEAFDKKTVVFFSCFSAHLRIAAAVVRTTADILDVLAGR